MPIPPSPTPAESAALAFVAAINTADAAQLAPLLHPDHAFTDALGHTHAGRDRMLAAWPMFYAAFPNYRIELDHIVSTGNQVVLTGRASGSWQSAPAKHWSVPAALLAEVESGLILRWTVFCDTAWTQPPAD